MSIVKKMIILICGLLFCNNLYAQSQKVEGSVPKRVVLGGKAVVMVADLIYTFPAIRNNIIAVAGADQGLGVFLSTLDSAWASKPSMDRQAGAEVYAALDPDIIILKSTNKAALGKNLETLKLETLYINLETPEDYFNDIKEIGNKFGQQNRADELINYFSSMIEDTERRIALESKESKPSVLVIQPAGGAFEVPPAEWMQTRIIKMAGGVPVWEKANPGSGWGKITIEQIALWNPDVICVIQYSRDSKEVVTSLFQNSGFKALSAWKNKKIYGFPQDFYSWDQPTTRWIMGLRWTAKLLHPSFFEDVNIIEELRTFYHTLFMMNDVTFNKLILKGLKGDYEIRP